MILSLPSSDFKKPTVPHGLPPALCALALALTFLPSPGLHSSWFLQVSNLMSLVSGSISVIVNLEQVGNYVWPILYHGDPGAEEVGLGSLPWKGLASHLAQNCPRIKETPETYCRQETRNSVRSLKGFGVPNRRRHVSILSYNWGGLMRSSQALGRG